MHRTVFLALCAVASLIYGQPASYEEWLRNATKVTGGKPGLFDPRNPYDRLPPMGADPAFECGWRKAAWAYAQKLQPHQPNLHAVFDALQLSTCNMTLQATGYRPAPAAALRTFGLPRHADATNTFYVAVDGDDQHPGSLAQPFRTIERALHATRSVQGPGTIVLRAGTHFLDATLHLATADNGLTIQNYNGEEAIVSGAQTLQDLKWTAVHTGSAQHWKRLDNECLASPMAQVGVVAGAEECFATCRANSSCLAWTFFSSESVHTARHGRCLHSGTATSPASRSSDFYPERGCVSGALETDNLNVWVADLSQVQGGPPAEISGLRVDGGRAWQARYPNANLELDLFPTGWINGKTQWFGLMHGEEPETNIVVDSPDRGFEQDEFQNYVLGIGGTCLSFTPPEGYWCSSNTSGGGAFTYRIPAGLVYSDTLLPNSPKYQNVTDAIIQAWRPGHWASWMFLADGWHPENKSFTWSSGGFQGARGSNNGQEWFIQNVMAELDSPNEYYYDKSSHKLYFFYNATAGTAPPTTLQATKLKVYISAVASQQDPIKGVSIKGLTFRDGAATFLDPHGMPSGGDWALQRTALLFFEGTEGVTVDGCTLIRNDGVGMMVSGYNRDTTFSNNEVVWNGDSALAGWGYSDGIDGTNGEQPRHTTIYNNFIHEIGHFEKQSSMWFQAITAQSNITNNIFFNGPRALINFNDGFGGANNLENNLLINSCRESSDHGPINSWDRQPFLTKINNGSSSLIPAYNRIHHNFAVANYGADGGCFDTDDGSSWYMVDHNFFIFGGHKSDFNGHNKRSHSNINVYPSVYGPRCVMVPLPDPKLGHDWDEAYSNCTCILATAGETYLDLGNCPKDVMAQDLTIILGSNKLYAPQAKVTVKCQRDYTLDEWQAAGFDKGTTVQDSPSVQQIVEMGRQLLGW
eukprot:m.157013 g.157013  ORF g.157013 m.157013 type:complete len:921 (+) comp20843_c1_seq1:32-2794(+)